MNTLQQPGPPGEPMTVGGYRVPLAAPQARSSARQPRTAAARDLARLAVVAALDGPGAVIVGQAGIGKTTLAREAVQRYGRGFHVHIRGSTLSSQTPYGALAWLLSDVPPDVLASPVLVLRALETQLLRQAAGSRIVMVIDNAEEIDDLGVLVTSELCRRGTVSLLLISADVIRCHPEYVRLWTDGALKRIDVVPLNLPQTGELLAAAAGGPLTTLAQRMLWRQSRGNPLLSSLLCRDHIAAKSLVQRRGFWTWAGPLVHSGELPERVETVLRRFSPEERRAVEILALCRELPLEILLQLVPAHIVDALEEGTAVTISGGRGQPVRLAWHFQPATIAARIPFGRSRDLWAEAAQVVVLPELNGAAAAGLASWSLSVGIPLGPHLAAAAARWSNETGNTGAARRYARAAAAPRPLPVLLEEADALRAEGNHAQAHRILAGVESGSEVPKETRIRVLTGRALASARSPWLQDNPWLLLEQAEQLLPADSGVRPGPGLQVTLARAELLSLEGRLSQLPVSLTEDFEDPAAPITARLWAGLRLAQQHAAAGRFTAATELAALVRSMMGTGVRIPARTGELLFHHLVLVLIRCGELDEALALTEAAAQPDNLSGLRSSTGTELPAGLVHAYAGRRDTALELLIPALAQLESHDPDGMLPLASAAAAYCGMPARPAGATLDLDPYPESGYRTDPPVEAAVRYFRILSGPGGSASAAEKLYLHAGAAMAAENLPDALLSYAAAALHGHQPAAADLAAAAASADGTLAAVAGNVAAGVLGRDIPALILAADAALGQGNTLLAHSVACAARGCAADGGSRTVLRRARQVEYESFRLLSPANSVPHALTQLGDFERELVLQAAAGDTSAVLGRRFHLSARTVDWHLGRVFARLHVMSRNDLREVLSKWDELAELRADGD